MYADGQNPDVRASDTERESVVTELGRHFQDGRLDQDELGQRVGDALAARTRRELDQLTTDLPRPAEGTQTPARRGPAGRPWPRVLPLVPLLFVAIMIAGAASGGWRHGWPFAPFGFLWLIIPALVIRARSRAWRRQWQ
jgi:Domain of unknown function (DUF1707)